MVGGKKKNQETSSGCDLQRSHFFYFNDSGRESKIMRSHLKKLLQSYKSLTVFFIWWTLFTQGGMVSSS